MDPNRKFVDACFDCQQDSGLSYQDYHNLIKEYFCDKFMLNSSFEQGIYIHNSSSYNWLLINILGLLLDIHGHNHKENWIELGYLLSNYQLGKNLKEKQAKLSSINKLASVSQQSFTNLIRGPDHSLGGIMQARYNLQVVPSPCFQSPTPSLPNYYSGGFITEHYTSKEMSKYRINAIQIELPAHMRNDLVVVESAKLIAFCIYEFYNINNFEMSRQNVNNI